MLRILLIAVIWLTLGKAAQAQAVCTTVIDLTRMFTTLEKVNENGGVATDAQLQDMHSINRRNDSSSVNYSIQNSPLRFYWAIVGDTFNTAETILQELGTQGNMSPTAALPSTLTSLNNAMGVLGRIDCPPPIGAPTDPGAETASPRSAITVTVGKGIGLLPVLNVMGLLMGIVIILGGPFIALTLYNKRAKSLRRRYDCEIVTAFTLLRSPSTKERGKIIDISRGGIKVRTSVSPSLKAGDILNVQINADMHLVTVRWQNACYFGGDFKNVMRGKDVRNIVGVVSKPLIRDGKSGRNDQPAVQSQPT